MNRLLAIFVFGPLVISAAAEVNLPPATTAGQPSAPVSTPPGAVASPSAPAAPAPEVAAIPQAFPRDRYEASWKKNPFLLKVAVIAQVKESWATDYALTSIAKMSGTYRVSIKNKKTGESKRLTEGGAADPEFKIVAVNLLPDRKSSSVQIEKSGEIAKLTYDPAMTAPQGRGAVPGQPGMGRQSIPGMPVIPGQPMGNVPAPNMRTTSVGSQGPVPVPGGNYPRPQSGGNMPSYSASASVNVAPPGSANTFTGGYPGTTAASRQGAVAPRTVASGSPQYMSTPNIAAPPGTTPAGGATIQNPGSVVINPGEAAAPAPTTTEGTTASGTTTPVTRRRTLIPAPVVNP